MSLFSFLFPKNEAKKAKDDLRQAYKDELIQIIVSGAIHGKRANPNLENKYDLFVSKTIVTYRKKE